MSKAKMLGVGKGNGRVHYCPSYLVRCKTGLTLRGVPWKSFGWTDEQVCYAYESIKAHPARPKPKVAGPGSGGHNRKNYTPSKITCIKISLGRNGIDSSKMTVEEMLEYDRKRCEPKYCATPGCNKVVKYWKPERVLCRSCSMSGNRNPAKLPGVGTKISKKLAGVPKSPEHRRKTSMWRKGKTVEQVSKNPEMTRRKRSENCRKYMLSRSKEVVFAQMSKTNSKLARIKVNYWEQQLFNLVESLFPGEYSLNTRGEILKIGLKKPDIVNINGQKKVIEFNGRAWHDEQEAAERIASFKRFGFDTCIVWSEEMRDTDALRSKLQKFHLAVY